jgi:hypothetical protein
VTGSLQISPRGTAGLDVTLPALVSVGSLELIRVSDDETATRLHLPSLTTVGSEGTTDRTFALIYSKIGVLDVPNLTTIFGNVEISAVPLCSVQMKRINDVTGSLLLQAVPSAPAGAWDALLLAGSKDATASALGCCLSDSRWCTGFDVNSEWGCGGC